VTRIRHRQCVFDDRILSDVLITSPPLDSDSESDGATEASARIPLDTDCRGIHCPGIEGGERRQGFRIHRCRRPQPASERDGRILIATVSLSTFGRSPRN